MTRRHRPSTLLLAALAGGFAFGCGRGPVQAPSAPALAASLQRLLDQVVAQHADIPGGTMAVDAPRLGLHWEGAAGLADPAAGTPMTPRHPVLLASNTKTYVAAATLRLVEDERLGLDDPIASRLPAAYDALLRGDGYDTGAITVRHLLTHTGGLFDYADRAVYPDKILADPGHRWTRDEQLAGAVDWGDPLGPPGTIYCYSDTDYVLLGAILEEITGLPLPAAVRELVGYDRLGLRATWFETLEPHPAGVPELAHQFFGEIDSATIDPSSDLYGGGGLAATMGDLCTFFGGLFRGRVYHRPATLATMLTTVEGAHERADGEASHLASGTYRMGLWQVDLDGLTGYRHSGFWGTSVTHVPELDLTIAVALNQNHAGAAFDAVVDGAAGVLRPAIEQGT